MNDFRAEKTENLANCDESKKPGIIRKLEEFIGDASVVEFLLTVAADEREYDLARIEVFKVLEVNDFEQNFRNKIGQILSRVLQESNELLVKNYAAMAGSSYMDIDEVSEVVLRILQDPSTDSYLRWNAFAAVKANGCSEKFATVLRSLLHDAQFSHSALSVLQQWNCSVE